MMRSMYAGVSGLRNHQIKMDVIGNNIANVNTVGFKKSRVNFQEMFNQTLRGASSPQGFRGGTNPRQVGLGVSISSIDTIHTPGSSMATGKMSDLMIEGDGFFIMDNNGQNLYTRAGTFDFDRDGNLVNPANGLVAKGWMANPLTQVIDPTQPTQDIVIPQVQLMQPQATDSVVFANNLDAMATGPVVGPPPVAATTYDAPPVEIYDSLGKPHTMQVTFTKTAVNNQWTYTVGIDSGNIAAAAGTLQFSNTGQLVAAAPTNIPAINFAPTGANAMTITPNFSALTQYNAESTVRSSSKTGNSSGSLQTYTIDSTGVVTGVYSNGLSLKLAQLALAKFNAPGGLLKMGENLYQESNNSGDAFIGAPGSQGIGAITPGSLEMSNVDLAQEFSDMIVTQRGFQANSRIITTSDQMLEELVNLKRG